MTMRRISTLLALLVCAAAIAAETAPPSIPVSDPDQPPVTDTAAAKADPAKPATDASKAPPPKAATESKGEKTKDGDFKPSEEISEDMAVAYPVDI
jgi:hypothetical protein